MCLLILRQSEWKEQLWFPKQEVTRMFECGHSGSYFSSLLSTRQKESYSSPCYKQNDFLFFSKMENDGSCLKLLLNCVDI